MSAAADAPPPSAGEARDWLLFRSAPMPREALRDRFFTAVSLPRRKKWCQG